ncbi:MAG: type II CRISPR RNA-guided endonuclease Cas9, partial [Candidatus Saccharimonas sp.]
MKYSIGLDIGTTSIGWAIIDEDNKRIEKVGVRIFEKPENPKDGKSLSEARRTARSTRRRLKRRRQRLNFIKRFFRDNNLLAKEQIEELLKPGNKLDPYKIREKALNEKIS